MKKLKSRYKGTDLRKKEIMEAALACFIELGYTETGISDILQRAGASTGSLYHHFGSKEELAGGIYLEGIRDYQSGFLTALEKEIDAAKGIHAVIEYHLKWVERNRQLAYYIFRMRHLEFMAQKEGEFAALNRKFFGRVAAWFRREITAGSIRRMQPDLYPVVLLGPCQEFAREYLAGRTTTSIDTAVKVLTDVAWISLQRK